MPEGEILKAPDGPANADFALEVSFKPGAENPGSVFQAITELVHAFQFLDKELVRSVDVHIEPLLILQDIESGSIRIWMRNALRNIEDEALRTMNWKLAVGKFLVKGKYVILKFLEEKETISDRAQIGPVREELLRLAQETEVLRLPAYTPVDLPKIITGVRQISSAMSLLTEGDEVKYISGDCEAALNRNFQISQEVFEDIFTMRTLENTAQMILKVKKPDYLGESMWEFRHEGHSIQAKIQDMQWLRDFQNREIDVRPGDALRVDILVQVKYGYDQEVIAQRHTILKIHEVLKAESEQGGLFA